MHASRIKIDAVTLYRAFFPRADFATGKMKERERERERGREIFIGALCAANIHTQRSRKGGSMLTIEKGESWRSYLYGWARFENIWWMEALQIKCLKCSRPVRESKYISPFNCSRYFLSLIFTDLKVAIFYIEICSVIDERYIASIFIILNSLGLE